MQDDVCFWAFECDVSLRHTQLSIPHRPELGVGARKTGQDKESILLQLPLTEDLLCAKCWSSGAPGPQEVQSINPFSGREN